MGVHMQPRGTQRMRYVVKQEFYWHEKYNRCPGSREGGGFLAIRAASSQSVTAERPGDPRESPECPCVAAYAPATADILQTLSSLQHTGELQLLLPTDQRSPCILTFNSLWSFSLSS